MNDKKIRELLKEMRFGKTTMRSFEIKSGCRLCSINENKRDEILALLDEQKSYDICGGSGVCSIEHLQIQQITEGQFQAALDAAELKDCKRLARIAKLLEQNINQADEIKQLQAELKEVEADYKTITGRNIRLNLKLKEQAEEMERLRELRKLGTDVMLALEDCIDHFDDENWPDDLGYSKTDLKKATKKYDKALKE